MPAKFVLKQTSNKGFRWNLVATNGRVIATSERYETRRAAMNGIESTRKNAPTAVVVEADGTTRSAGSSSGRSKMRHKAAAAPSADTDRASTLEKMRHGIL
ncbi:MAG: YegP family protein [Actinomycetota bacterium]|nr:YegP family protein [Actinomycetota bacterium]